MNRAKDQKVLLLLTIGVPLLGILIGVVKLNLNRVSAQSASSPTVFANPFATVDAPSPRISGKTLEKRAIEMAKEEEKKWGLLSPEQERAERAEARRLEMTGHFEASPSLQRQCEQGDRSSCFEVAQDFFEHHNLRASLRYLAFACGSNTPRACCIREALMQERSNRSLPVWADLLKGCRGE